MKRFLNLLGIAILSGSLTLGAYKLFLEPEPVKIAEEKPIPQYVSTTPATYTVSNSSKSTANLSADFTTAAEKTVNAVVHVKQYGIQRTPRNLMDFLRNDGVQQKRIRGAGSGVIFTEDGYIVTNNHVIDGATELEVTLNNNKSYKAEVIGTSRQADIAVLKIEADAKLSYIPFGDSNSAKIGEWVLAIGNPFNLTSTVTAGIISAKSRDLDEFDANTQSFIQTDAAINPGNSGGALINTKGELIGINTAITSQTGSYVGYAFAVPSNNVRKIVNDIIEYGDVQKAIIGISGHAVNPRAKENYDITESQGVVIAQVESGSGAEEAGLKEGDLIKGIDGLPIKKFADLSGYVNSKSPNDIINITISRHGNESIIPVKLKKYESYQIKDIGVEVVNPSKDELKRQNLDHGVKINRALTKRMTRYNLEGIIITEIDRVKVKSVADVKKIIESKHPDEDISVTLIDGNGEKREFVFQ
ncbi:S1C family serine protease [Aquimarina hainanensis]|uniref:S1C family serine protease n=1 Tax=Aquimarina hainanensis TaxID=1578017 RepID=A0ABW5NFI4_9FLAO|nr:trypsin-like peptidase domain-containing protein [Aquimarina sp. TRL1]QKX03380.1 PDZ domain-containing protein [Aquimarina sp. TRL1]